MEIKRFDIDKYYLDTFKNLYDKLNLKRFD